MIDIEIIFKDSTERMSLEDGEHTVGRSSEADISLPVSRVSKSHAVIRVAGDEMWVRDLGSTNGTEVGGARVGPDEVSVPPGARISFAGTMLFRQGERPAGSTGTTSVGAITMTMTESAETLLRYSQHDGFSNAGQERFLHMISALFELLAQGKRKEEVAQAACAFVGEHIRADRVVLLGEGSGGAAVDANARWTRGTEDPNAPLQLSTSIINHVMENRESVLVSNPMESDKFGGQQSIVALNLRSAMAAPLFDNERVRGMIYVDTSQMGVTYGQADLEVLTATANAVAVKLRNIHFESELETAAEIQRYMMPKRPDISGYDIAAKCVPQRGVGGDYYDFIATEGGKLAVAVGDVSGKGLPAALLMANVHATVRAQTLTGDDVNNRIGRANRLISETTADESFVTLFYGELDPERHELTYCNAGHEPAFLFNAGGGSTRLETSGIALGVIDTFTYKDVSVSMSPGDVVVVYSDGVTDAIDSHDEQFGIERLEETIAENVGLPAEEIVDAIVNAVDAHTGGRTPFDDVTVLILKRL